MDRADRRQEERYLNRNPHERNVVQKIVEVKPGDYSGDRVHFEGPHGY